MPFDLDVSVSVYGSYATSRDSLDQLVGTCENRVMKEVSIGVTWITPQSKDEMVKVFSQEVEEFSSWMEKLPDWKQQGGLTRPEKTLLLTYLIQKYVGNIDAKRYGPPEGF
jgi:hypothetical protein